MPGAACTTCSRKSNIQLCHKVTAYKLPFRYHCTAYA
jgi:hypothetical protein